MFTDETINGWLHMLFGNSEPGDATHYVMVATTGRGEVTAAGEPDLDKVGLTVSAIVPESPEASGMLPGVFVRMSVKEAVDRPAREDKIIHFALAVMEICTVLDDASDAAKAQARQLHAVGNLQKHPDMIEVTQLYAACRDGRRWVGQHFITGHLAGTVQGPILLDGPLDEREKGIERRMIRRAVGM